VVRDLSGAVPLLEPHCPRRGTSLEFAPVDAKGVRCCYHGWRLAVDGTILETPGEPAESTLKDRLCHGAYPVHESHGIVFAYIGPPDRQPPSPVYDRAPRHHGSPHHHVPKRDQWRHSHRSRQSPSPGLCREPGAVIPTYCNDTVVRVAPAATPSADKELLRKTGRRLAENYLRDPPLSVGR
jgi:hypothetical protein